MADPKYANLPGLDLDQPDVFETNDLPEADQRHHHGELDDDDVLEDSSIEKLHVTASEAFGKFKGKNVETENVDFSDAIRRTRRHGYVTWSGDYETTGGGENETLLQKYQRLNCQVGELLDEVQQVKESGQVELTGGQPGQMLSAMAAQTKTLQDQLATLKLEQTLGSELLKHLDDPRESAKEKLLLQIDALKRVKVAGGSNSPGGGSSVGPLTYELLMKPETFKLEEQRRISELDKRLEKLEGLISFTHEKMSLLSKETEQTSVVGALCALNGRMNLLEPSHLDHVEGRLSALIQKMNAISSEQQQRGIDDKHHEKVNELYELCVKTDAESVVVPQVVDRLDALQGLHQQASQFGKAMAQLEAVQHKLEANLSTNQKIMMETQVKFADNLSSIQKNFENLDSRLKKLKA